MRMESALTMNRFHSRVKARIYEREVRFGGSVNGSARRTSEPEQPGVRSRTFAARVIVSIRSRNVDRTVLEMMLPITSGRPGSWAPLLLLLQLGGLVSSACLTQSMLSEQAYSQL